MAGHKMHNPDRGAARRGLHARLRREDPDYVPPPDDPRERRLQTWGLLAIFLGVAAAILAVAVLGW